MHVWILTAAGCLRLPVPSGPCPEAPSGRVVDLFPEHIKCAGSQIGFISRLERPGILRQREDHKRVAIRVLVGVFDLTVAPAGEEPAAVCAVGEPLAQKGQPMIGGLAVLVAAGVTIAYTKVVDQSCLRDQRLCARTAQLPLTVEVTHIAAVAAVRRMLQPMTQHLVQQMLSPDGCIQIPVFCIAPTVLCVRYRLGLFNDYTRILRPPSSPANASVCRRFTLSLDGYNSDTWCSSTDRRATG